MASPSSYASSQFGSVRIQAQQLLLQLETNRSRQGNPAGRILLNAGIRELVPWGWQGTGRKIAAAMGRAARFEAETAAHRQIDSLVNEARSIAGQHSILEPTLHVGGNSRKLIRRFGSALDKGSPAARLRILIRTLDSTCRLPLIGNHEVPRALEERQYQKVRSRLEQQGPSLSVLLRELPGPQDASYFYARLPPFEALPRVATPLKGAIGRLTEGGPDAYREGVSAVRVALDELLGELGGERDWKKALDRVVAEDTERGVVRAYHHLLSKAAHSGHQPTREELQVVLELFATIALRLVQLRPATSGETQSRPDS